MRDAANSFVATLLHNSFVATLLHGRHGKEVGKKDLKGRWNWEVGKLGWGGGGLLTPAYVVVRMLPGKVPRVRAVVTLLCKRKGSA